MYKALLEKNYNQLILNGLLLQIAEIFCTEYYIYFVQCLHHRENTRREEYKYLECENRQLGLSAIATYIFKPPTEKFKIGR